MYQLRHVALGLGASPASSPQTACQATTWYLLHTATSLHLFRVPETNKSSHDVLLLYLEMSAFPFVLQLRLLTKVPSLVATTPIVQLPNKGLRYRLVYLNDLVGRQLHQGTSRYFHNGRCLKKQFFSFLVLVHVLSNMIVSNMTQG